MALQYSVGVRNAKLDAVEVEVGALPIIEIRVGAPPSSCSDPATGALLIYEALPSDWMNAASGGTKTKAGTWTLTGLTGITTSDAGYFRINKPGSPSECDIQGTITATAGGGDMTMDNISIAAAQVVTVNTFTLTAGNA